MVGTSYDATMALFGAVCAFGGALAYAAWSGALDLYRSDVETRQRWSSSDEFSPRQRRLIARQKSMSASNDALSKLLGSSSAAEKGVSRSSFLSTVDQGVIFGAQNKIVVAMVGLPARGKSYIVKMMVRYLEWIGIPTKIFNVGDMRRKCGLAGASAAFFRTGDESARRQREELAMACQEEMYRWLDAQPSSCVAIFDATNTTRARREILMQRCRTATLIFVESICNDREILERNYRMKLQNADYRGRDPEEALRDFLERVSEYEKRYETIEDDEGDGSVSYIKIIDVGEKMVARKCSGYLTSQISFFLGNIHITPRKIWLALHAETLEETRCGVRGITAGGGLTEYGSRFAVELARFVRAEHAAFQQQQALDHQGGGGLLVLTGNAQSHRETIAPLVSDDVDVLATSLLNELCGGDFDGISVEELEARYPGVWKARNADKLRFRYPGAGGESYVDLITRLRPILIELERQRRNVLLVSHLAVQRCLYAYFVGTPAAEIPYIKLPHGAVVEINPAPHGAIAATHLLVDKPRHARSMQHCVSSVGDLVHKFAEVPPSADGFVR
ncbi:hypothetical protein CTAYLR_009774 [Chrysophaeum taylorii]|uniref:6-phosphofructo-2-kinase domain-containing protein n=1 Tax=Chrysophaeum taylorii TaxID=2483200 RepID=A0AAD7UHC6_9STRA|nr:hypothetical protein CTAYLR_009774 [Chrysophaeum taylorii]